MRRPPRRPTRSARRPMPDGAGLLLLAVALSAAVWGLGQLRAPRALETVRETRPGLVTVRLGAADRAAIDGWAEFFACHGLVNSELVINATLRANGFAEDPAWRPERPIRLDLAPSADQPRATPAEAAVQERVVALANGPAVDLARACAHPAAAPAASAAEMRP